ncbi:MAG: efflux RND transporter permease subunit, partial [Peptococcaceae bacterium]|nr:efflux RND transporter permease subunit [Peptococcaceae bacterium]
MNIGKFSVKRPVTIAMAALVLILFGVVSFTRMSIDLMPKMDLPIMAVMTNYDGAGPEEVEERVTKPLESSMASISGMSGITSISSAGSSVVMIMFDYGTNLDSATNDVRDALEFAKMILPEEAQDITILKLDINSMPIITLGVSGERSLEDIKKIVEDKVAPRLERIEGVASVDVSGGCDQQVSITADPYKLSAYGLNSGTITQIVMGENANHPGGYITQGTQEILVRTLGQYETIEQLADTQVSLPTGGTVRLGDVVDIQVG